MTKNEPSTPQPDSAVPIVSHSPLFYRAHIRISSRDEVIMDFPIEGMIPLGLDPEYANEACMHFGSLLTLLFTEPVLYAYRKFMEVKFQDHREEMERQFRQQRAERTWYEPVSAPMAEPPDYYPAASEDPSEAKARKKAA